MSPARLWQLISPSLPVGAYAYSQGLEQVVEKRQVFDEESAMCWVCGLLQYSISSLDIPVLARLYAAWQTQDVAAAVYWDDFLQAARAGKESLAEELQTGGALNRILQELGKPVRRSDGKPAGFVALFAAAAVQWDIPLPSAAQGYAWAWCENQVAAAIKLIPLGQSAGQRILFEAGNLIPAAVENGLSLTDGDIGASAFAQGIAGALHETQYSRLFRS